MTIQRAVIALLLSTSLAASAQGYVITPSGTIIFPDAPPPAGDTSTLSGAGPNVSAGPLVGPGPQVGAGPEVGNPSHADTLAALDIIRQADASLAAGDTDGVDEQLVRAEAALWGRTWRDVEAAREALAREDLMPARQYLAAALAEDRVRR
jgi:hypothetical protein